MKTFEEVWARARALVNAELERRLVEASKRLPHLCTFNHRQPLDVRPTIEGAVNAGYNTVSYHHGQTIGLCMLGAQKVDGRWMVAGSDQEEAKWAGTICEDPIDAQRCPYFESAVSKETVLNEILNDLANSEWLTQNMPELQVLLWVLDEEAPPRFSWLERLRMHFRVVSLEPLQPSVDPLQLLP